TEVNLALIDITSHLYLHTRTLMQMFSVKTSVCINKTNPLVAYPAGVAHFPLLSSFSHQFAPCVAFLLLVTRWVGYAHHSRGMPGSISKCGGRKPGETGNRDQ